MNKDMVYGTKTKESDHVNSLMNQKENFDFNKIVNEQKEQIYHSNKAKPLG